MIKSFLSVIKNIFNPSKKILQEVSIEKDNFNQVISLIPNAPPPDHRLEEDVYTNLRALKTPNINLFWNLYIPYRSYEDTGYMEVDVIATTPKGIFVFECKDYNAHISGDITIQKWTAKYANGETHPMANPIYQNKQHINVLSKYLSLPENDFISIVIMKFKSLRVDIGKNLLFVDDEYLKHRLKIALKMDTTLISSEDLNKINLKLLNTMNPDESIKSKHRERINNKFYS